MGFDQFGRPIPKRSKNFGGGFNPNNNPFGNGGFGSGFGGGFGGGNQNFF